MTLFFLRKSLAKKGKQVVSDMLWLFCLRHLLKHQGKVLDHDGSSFWTVCRKQIGDDGEDFVDELVARRKLDDFEDGWQDCWQH